MIKFICDMCQLESNHINYFSCCYHKYMTRGTYGKQSIFVHGVRNTVALMTVFMVVGV